jgi:hypothetical protein
MFCCCAVVFCCNVLLWNYGVLFQCSAVVLWCSVAMFCCGTIVLCWNVLLLWSGALVWCGNSAVVWLAVGRWLALSLRLATVVVAFISPLQPHRNLIYKVSVRISSSFCRGHLALLTVMRLLAQREKSALEKKDLLCACQSISKSSQN